MTNEDLYDISKQPAPTCPMINDILEQLEDIRTTLKGYERAGESELREKLSRIECIMGELITFGHNKDQPLEKIRTHITSIREWGEEWKQLVLKTIVSKDL